MARYVNDEFKLADFNRPWGPFFSTTSKSSRFFLSKNFSSLIDSFELCGLKDKYVSFCDIFIFLEVPNGREKLALNYTPVRLNTRPRIDCFLSTEFSM